MLRIIPLVLFILLSVSCTNHQYSLQPIEKLIWQDTDSAFYLLNSLSTPSSTHDKALYILYNTITARRLSTQQPSNAAINYSLQYFHSTHQIHYYFLLSVQWGGILLERQEYNLAMNILKESESLLSPSSDIHTTILLHNYLGYLYRHSRDYRQSYLHYNTAYNLSRQINQLDWIIENGISLLNLPVHPDLSHYKQFADTLLPVITSNLLNTDSVLVCKAYTNISKYYESTGDISTAYNCSQSAISFAAPTNYRAFLNHARLCDITGKSTEADSLYHLSLNTPDPIVLHRVYRALFSRALKNRAYSTADSLLSAYLITIDSIYECRDRQEIQEIAARYDLRTTELNHERQVRKLFAILFILLATLILSYITYRLNGYYKYQKLRTYLLAYYRLLQERHHLSEQSMLTITQKEALNTQLITCDQQIKNLSKELNRYKIIFGHRSRHHLLHNENLTALNFFLSLSLSDFHYNALCHRSHLYHWMNLVENQFVRRLIDTFPALTPREVEICCFFRIGYNNNRISEILSISPDTIRRSLIRLYPVLNVLDKTTFLYFIKNF